MSAAYQSLFSVAPAVAIPTTHVYMQFSPQNIEEIKLLDNTDEFFYDYPLHYGVEEMGDYYQELTGTQMPVLYAIVAPSFISPISNFQIIDNINTNTEDPLIVAESMRLHSSKKDLDECINDNRSLSKANITGPTKGKIPIEPDCPPGCVAELRIDDTTVPLSYTWVCNCNPPPPPPPPSPFLNACGCAVFSDKKKPGGCVKVEDTEVSIAGPAGTLRSVRRVKIIIKDTWFTEDETFTDDLGCWKIDDKFSGKAWMWVRFNNDRCKIRGVGTGVDAAWQWATTIKDYVGVISGGTFNNIEVNYNSWTDEGSQIQRYWGAATVNNTVHEFHDYASQDGILPPPFLDIYVGKSHGFGFATMTNHIGGQAMALALGSGLTGNVFIVEPFGVFLSVFTPAQIVINLMPDIFVGINNNQSDNIKRLAYHEIGHASHFNKVNTLFWMDLIAAEVAANGHGEAGSTDAGRIAICESWAEHIGLTYAHKQYPDKNFDDRLEETRNATLHHIPIGLYHDLSDTHLDDVQACDDNFPPDCGVIDDQISGFTYATQFGKFSSSVTSPEEFITKMKAGQTASTASKIDLLFNSY